MYFASTLVGEQYMIEGHADFKRKDEEVAKLGLSPVLTVSCRSTSTIQSS